jgi:hypothetical protein
VLPQITLHQSIDSPSCHIIFLKYPVYGQKVNAHTLAYGPNLPLSWPNGNNLECDQLLSSFTTDLYIFWTLLSKTVLKCQFKAQMTSKDIKLSLCDSVSIGITQNASLPTFEFHIYTWNFVCGLKTKLGT